MFDNDCDREDFDNGFDCDFNMHTEGGRFDRDFEDCDFDDDVDDVECEDDGQPSEYTEWQDYMGGDDWDHGQYDCEY